MLGGKEFTKEKVATLHDAWRAALEPELPPQEEQAPSVGDDPRFRLEDVLAFLRDANASRP